MTQAAGGDPMTGAPRPDRRQVLERLIAQYRGELARSWVEGKSMRWVREKELSLQSACKELAHLTGKLPIDGAGL